MDAPTFIDAAMAAFKERLVASIDRIENAGNARSFCEAEREVFALTMELASEFTRGVLQQISDDAERRKEANERIRAIADAKGIEVRAQRHRVTLVRTLSGKTVKVKTPYFTAAPRGRSRLKTRGKQGTGVYPVLDQLGILGRSTPALRLLVSRTVCEANSVKSALELLGAAGIEMDHKGALRLTYLVTSDALRARKAAIKAQKVGNDAGEFAGRRVVVAVDGGRVNIRRRVGGRPKTGGRKRFETEWREPKILTLYVLDEHGKRDRKVASVIDGTLGDADAVYALMTYHLLRMGAHLATEVVLVADGAPWIWNRADGLRRALGLQREQFTEIVDYFHVVERLGEFSKSQPGWDETERRLWLGVQKSHLKAGKIENIESAVRHAGQRDPKGHQTELEYWGRNRERLRYATFRRRSLPIGSGAVESAVRRVVNLRLKGASITWTEEHAEGIIHLRAHAKSGRWRELERVVLANTGWRPTSRLPKAAA